MRRAASALALAGLALGACERPRTLVICHNGNCAGTGAPALDDTPAALRASLALRWQDRPVIDGVELDTMWHRPTGACLFEHGPGEVLPPDTVAEATEIIADHLTRTEVAWNGDRFHVFIDLKPYVAGRFDAHTPAERVAHADCVLDVLARLTAVAAGRHRLRFVFESADLALLDALVARPRWPGRLEGDVEVRLASEARPLRGPPRDQASPRLDVMQYLPTWVTDAQLEAYTALGYELCLWFFVTTPEVLAAIERHSPRYVITGEALLLRRWLAD